MIRIAGDRFVDEHGRTLLLRGVNLGGSSKVPAVPNGATHVRDGFFEHRTVSFVGRPFPLAEADEHFARLRKWGFNFLRFLVTWEAVEHEGPARYDEAYLDFLTEVVRKAGEHGFSLIIDPHQDVWSRFTGGDGAPGWTLEAVGFDMRNFATTGAALVHAVHGDPLPRMIWPTNGVKLAAATMFTLFFGGDDFAPGISVDGEPVQRYLQRHYFAAMRQIALRLKGMPHVVGYDTMNEPLAGYIGWRDLERPGGILRLGQMPSPFQAMLLGAGYPQTVERWKLGLTGLRRAGRTRVNAEGARAWREGAQCIWRRVGVWDVDSRGQPHLIRPDHFCTARGLEVDFDRDSYRPFANRFADAIRDAHAGAAVFLETEAGSLPPEWDEDDAPNVVFAPHWYDGFVLVTKRFWPFLAADFRTGRPVFTRRRIRKSFAQQVAYLKGGARRRLGDVPVLVGEFGVPFDMHRKEAYRTGNFRRVAAALDRSFRSMEDTLAHCTLWNYTSDNSHAHGDQWNDEDLSIFSRDDQCDGADIHSGGRALEAAVRPYARAVAGTPLSMSFDYRRKRFTFTFHHDASLHEPTEVFVPDYQYPRGVAVVVSDGSFELDEARQLLRYRHGLERDVHTIEPGSCVSPRIGVVDEAIGDGRGL